MPTHAQKHNASSGVGSPNPISHDTPFTLALTQALPPDPAVTSGAHHTIRRPLFLSPREPFVCC
jgi:hypothetical protein